MGLFRRAKTECPSCKKERRADVGEQHFNAKVWQITCCDCDAKLKAPIIPDWWIAYTDPEGKYRRRKIGPNRRAAQRAHAKVQTEIAEGKYIDRRATCKHTLGELVEKYLAYIKPIRTDKNYRAEVSALSRPLKFLGAGMRLDKIKERKFKEYRRARDEDGKTCGTINRELSCLGAALTHAVEQGWLASRPKIALPNPRNERERFLTKGEAARLIEHCPEFIRLFVRAALATGMRKGELVAMEWSWVDLRKGLISIPATATKSKRGRYIPINGDLREVLEECRDKARPDDPRVFTLKGRAPKSIWYGFKKAAKAAGIEDWKSLRVHDLRHTALSWMVQGGEPLYNVAVIAGHSNLKVTQRYAHLAPGHLKSAMEHTRLDVEEAPKGTHRAPTSKIVQFPSAANSGG
jgi:integrase